MPVRLSSRARPRSLDVWIGVRRFPAQLLSLQGFGGWDVFGNSVSMEVQPRTPEPPDPATSSCHPEAVLQHRVLHAHRSRKDVAMRRTHIGLRDGYSLESIYLYLCIYIYIYIQ